MLSPNIEVLFRKLYWKNVKRLMRFRPVSNKAEAGIESKEVNFDKVCQLIAKKVMNTGQIVIVHSSYKALKSTKLSPTSIILKIQQAIGESSTLVMPVIRTFKEEGELSNYLISDLSSIVCEYDKFNTPVSSGVLPTVMMTLPGAYISDCPLNPIVAIGPHAPKMIQKNIHDGEVFPHGKNSAWYYCLAHKALVIGIGVRLHHNLTIRRVFEELGDWPIKSWFRVRHFLIKRGEFAGKEICVYERKPEFTVFLAEENMGRELLKNKILEKYDIDGVNISFVQSENLYKYMKSKKNKKWPYYM